MSAPTGRNYEHLQVEYSGNVNDSEFHDIDIVDIKHNKCCERDVQSGSRPGYSAICELNVPNGCKHVFVKNAVSSDVKLFDRGTRNDVLIHIVGGEEIETLEIDDYSAYVDFRQMNIHKLRTVLVDSETIRYMGKVHTIDAPVIDIGDDELPNSVRVLSCITLPKKLPHGLLEVEYETNPFNSVPDTVEKIVSHRLAGNLPRNLRHLVLEYNKYINLRELCPDLETLSVRIRRDKDVSLELFPTSIRELKFEKRCSNLVCKNMDFRNFIHLTVLELYLGDTFETFTPPPCLDVLTINNTYLNVSFDFCKEFFDKIGYVNKLAVLGATRTMFDVLRELVYGTLFLLEMPLFDPSQANFPVIITDSNLYCFRRIDLSTNFKGIITIVDSPDNVCDIGRDNNGNKTIKYGNHNTPYTVVGVETVDGIYGKINVIHSTDPNGYIRNVKSARN